MKLKYYRKEEQKIKKKNIIVLVLQELAQLTLKIVSQLVKNREQFFVQVISLNACPKH